MISLSNHKHSALKHKEEMRMKDILRAYKFRIYPNAEQQLNLEKTFGCSRYIYNWALAQRKEAFSQGEKLTNNVISQRLTELKKQTGTKWLNEVSSVCLQQSLANIDAAYKNFFKKTAKFPVFKKKSNKQAARYVKSAFVFKDGNLKLAKHSEPLKVKYSRTFTGEVTSVTISKEPDGKFYISMLVKEQFVPCSKSAKQIGIDLGIKDFATYSNGTKVANPNHYRKSLKKLKKLQQNLSKKQRGSGNYKRLKLKIARIHSKIRNQRTDFLQKLSTQIVNENQVICVEDLKVSSILRNKRIAKLAGSLGWNSFLSMIEYKCLWNDRTFVKIDQFYPSSKTCNSCSFVKQDLKLHERTWKCPQCGTIHDRDINAANNILAVGLTAVLKN